jgi:outer membrane protein TolC
MTARGRHQRRAGAHLDNAGDHDIQRHTPLAGGARRVRGIVVAAAVLIMPALAGVVATAWPVLAVAQVTSAPGADTTVRTVDTELDSLVRLAAATSPAVRAAVARAEAARARVGPAGARPDPMLMAGVQNLPLSEPGFSGEMTMKMVGLGQTFPYPGKLSLRTRAAEHELLSAQASLRGAQLEVEEAVERAYYDLAFLDRALEIVGRNQRLLVDFMKVTEARYGVGTGGQEEVLRVRVEAARLGEEAVALTEQRRAVLAQLNAVLDRPSDTPMASPAIPRRVARAAIADSVREIRFVSTALGARAADSPLPPLETLQTIAIQLNPMLRAHEAMIAAQAARVELARKEHLPDFDVSLSYGQRDGFSDMVSAQLSIPLPIQRGRKQDLLVAEVRSELAALHAEHEEQVNALRADVARLHAELERDRAQLALYVKAILPQGRAALSSATAGYQVGRADFLTLLDAQATLFTYETTYFRVLSDFAKTLAELERVVGQEIVR